MKVLIHLSHSVWDPAISGYRPYGGAPGESAWIREDLVPKVVVACAARGIMTTLVAGDLLDHPEFHQDYDAFIAPHYEANVHSEGGSFWGRAAASLTAAKDDRLGNLFWARYSALAGRPQDRFNWNNVNVTDYYGFRLTTPNTPGILVEHGVGWNVPSDYDFTWLRNNSALIANVWGDTLMEFGGIEVPLRFAVFAASRAFAVPATPAQVLAEDYAALYRAEAPKAGIRAELAFAQAWKETGRFTFLTTTGQVPASGYTAAWNNPAGLGVTGAAGVGNRFASRLEGVRAHLQHLVWYLAQTSHATTPYCTPLADQRHFGEHKTLGNDVRKLNGKWAIPGDLYGETISDIAEALPAPVALTPEQKAARVYDITEAREALVWIARHQRGLDVERGDAFDPARPPLDPRIDKR